MKLFFLMGLALVAGPASASTHARHHHAARAHKTKGQLQSEMQAVHGQKARLTAKLRQTRTKAHAVKLDIVSVDHHLESVKTDLSSTRQNLQTSRHRRQAAERQLAQSTERLSKTRALVGKRMREIYTQGNGNGIATYLGTRSGGELASRGYLMGAIERKDRDLFNQYRQEQKEVKDRKTEADQRVREVQSLESRERSKELELAQVRQDKGEVLNGLRAQQSAIQREIAQFDADEREIAQRIAAFHRSVAHRAHGGPALQFSGRFSRPVNAPITSTFGMRYHPVLHYVRMHEGIDFGAPIGTTIHSAAAGEVIFTGMMRGYGHVVIVDHGSGLSTVYAHTSAVFVSNGERVGRGQAIAAVGNSGLSTGPHLHFEVRVNNHAVNPMSHF